jgi:hypothetical protein
VNIECSHCNRMLPAEKVFDRDWGHTICFDCSQKGGHSNTRVCPKCSLKKPEICDHEFFVLATSSGSDNAWTELTKCKKCGQKRSHPISGGEIAESYKMHLEIMKKAEEAEDVTCPHCGIAFKVAGDIATRDVVYTTCVDCYQKGHRRMPARCEVCVGGLAGIAKEIAEETLKSIKKAEVEEAEKSKYNRNIVL